MSLKAQKDACKTRLFPLTIYSGKEFIETLYQILSTPIEVCIGSMPLPRKQTNLSIYVAGNADTWSLCTKISYADKEQAQTAFSFCEKHFLKPKDNAHALGDAILIYKNMKSAHPLYELKLQDQDILLLQGCDSDVGKPGISKPLTVFDEARVASSLQDFTRLTEVLVQRLFRDETAQRKIRLELKMPSAPYEDELAPGAFGFEEPVLRTSESTDDANSLTPEKIRRTMVLPDFTGVSLRSIGGYAFVKEEIAKVVTAIKSPDVYKKWGVKLPTGILLHGPAGTGKTTFAKVLASQLGLASTFINVRLSDIVSMYQAISENNIHAIFDYAQNPNNFEVRFSVQELSKKKETALCKLVARYFSILGIEARALSAKKELTAELQNELISFFKDTPYATAIHDFIAAAAREHTVILFIDEIDSLATPGEVHDRTQRNIINTLKVCLDGIGRVSAERKTNVIAVFATNEPLALNEAFKRSGRINTEIYIGLPTPEDRADIFKVHLENAVQAAQRPLYAIADFSEIIQKTEGLSPADLEQLVQNALKQRAYQDITQVHSDTGVLSKEDILQAITMFTKERERSKQKQIGFGVKHSL